MGWIRWSWGLAALVAGCPASHTIEVPMDAAIADTAVVAIAPGARTYCVNDSECDRGSYCELVQCGLAGSAGRCRVRTDDCEEFYAPVCGCDGMTHGNACTAANRGMSIDHVGACGARSCGSRGAPVQCGEDEYCRYPLAQCGDTDVPGVCYPRGVGDCPAERFPVCGCNRRTYGSPCDAQLAGVSILHAGESEPDGGYQCGGEAGLECPNDRYYCSYDVADECGGADERGICRLRPTFCEEEPGGAAVCGCDSRVYESACYAEMAGVSVARAARCVLPE